MPKLSPGMFHLERKDGIMDLATNKVLWSIFYMRRDEQQRIERMTVVTFVARILVNHFTMVEGWNGTLEAIRLLPALYQGD